MTYCYCVTYNGYGDESYFCMEKVFYGENAEEKAVELALKLNMEYVNELGVDTNCLINHTKSKKEILNDYIDSLDYSGGNYKYDSAFYAVSSCEIHLC